MRIQCVKCKNVVELKFFGCYCIFSEDVVIACLGTMGNVLKCGCYGLLIFYFPFLRTRIVNLSCNLELRSMNI